MSINRFYFPSKKTKLVVGQVQSGKTAFMIRETEKYLTSDVDSVVIIGGTTTPLLKQSIKRFSDMFLDNFEFIDLSTTKRNQLPNKKSIILCLKGDVALTKLKNFLSNSDYDKKIVIFDDESDFGSINVGKNGVDSKLFTTLREIIECIPKLEYISITATPYADLMNKDALKFDEIKVLEPSSEYTGIDFFEESDCYHIDDIEEKLGVEDKRYWGALLIDHVNRTIEAKKSGLKSQLIVNTDLNTTPQEQIASLLQGLSLDFSKYMLDKFKEREVAKTLLEDLSKNIVVLNQKKDDDRQKNIIDDNCIIVGGSMISRGLTFENPITIVMLNAPQEKIAADTLLQRARWFGYRKQRSKFLKIYMNQKIRDSYKEAQKLQKLTYDFLRKNNSSQISEIRELLKEFESELITPTGGIKSGRKS